MRSVYFVLGLLFIALGFVGAFLPVLPTTPFLILATACFARSSPRLENWLLSPTPVSGRRCGRGRSGAIPLRAKRLAVAGIGHRIFVVLAWQRAGPDPDDRRRRIHAGGSGVRLQQTIGLTAPCENFPSKGVLAKYENNPMQSSRRPPPSIQIKRNLTHWANQRHSLIIPKSCKRLSFRTAGTSIARAGPDAP